MSICHHTQAFIANFLLELSREDDGSLSIPKATDVIIAVVVVVVFVVVIVVNVAIFVVVVVVIVALVVFEILGKEEPVCF